MILAQLARCVICLAICTVNYNVILLGSTCGDVGLACSDLDHAMRYPIGGHPNDISTIRDNKL